MGVPKQDFAALGLRIQASKDSFLADGYKQDDESADDEPVPDKR